MDVSAAPNAPGVYYLLTKTRQLSYVGKAVNIRRRLAQHAKDPRWANIADVRWELVSSDLAAQAREADVIIALRPNRNRAIKYDGGFYSFVTVGPKGLALGEAGDHGCFPHLGRGAYAQPGRHCIDGFKALDRIVRDTKPDAALVHDFLAGTSDALLRTELDIDQPHTRHGIERARDEAAQFYVAGPRWMRALRLRHGGHGQVTQEQFVAWVKAEVEEILR